MAVASDFHYITFREPCTTLGDITMSTTGSKIITLQGKDIVWCVEAAKERHAAAYVIDSRYIDKFVYDAIIKVEDLNYIVALIDATISAKKFLINFDNLVDGSVFSEQQYPLFSLNYATSTSIYGASRPVFSSGDSFVAQKIKSLEESIWKLAIFRRDDIIKDTYESDYNLTGTDANFLSKHGLIYYHVAGCGMHGDVWEPNYPGEFVYSLKNYTGLIQLSGNSYSSYAKSSEQWCVYKLYRKTFPRLLERDLSVNETTKYVLVKHTSNNWGSIISSLQTIANLPDNIEHPVKTQEAAQTMASQWGTNYEIVHGYYGFPKSNEYSIQLIDTFQICSISDRTGNLVY